MRGRWKSLERSVKGFTLVEMIVVLALMAVLLSWAGVEALRYHRYALWRRQEEYARTIYLAVQSELIERAGEGRLAQLEGLFTPEDAMDLTGLIGADGQELTVETVWPSKEGAIYVLEAPAGSWPEVDLSGSRWGSAWSGSQQEMAVAGTQEEDRQARKRQALYELIRPYILDRSILQEGAIRIELDPSAGLVYGVFYSSYQPGGFYCGQEGRAFGESTVLEDGIHGSEKGDVTDRREEAREEQLIGYYGVDTLSGAVDGREERPVIRGLKLELEKGRGQQLILRWQVEAKDLTAWKDLTYEVKVYGSFREDASFWEERPAREEKEICTILLGQELLGEGSAARYPGIPSRFYSLDPEGGYQVMQAVVRQDGWERWYCFPVMLDGARCQIVLVLDQWDMDLAGDTGAAWTLGESIGVRVSKSSSGYSTGDRASRSDSRYSDGRTDRSSAAWQAGWSEDVLPWYPLREQIQEAGWELSQLEGMRCTVVGYGADYVAAQMKESNWEALEFAEEEDEEAEDEDNMEHGMGAG